jgi:hypothetical protein
MNLAQYKVEFLEAHKRARQLGYHSDDISNFTEREDILTGEIFDSLLRLIRRKAVSMQPEMFAGQCLNVNMFMQECIEKELGLKSYFTLGYVRAGDKTLFEFTERDLKAWLQSGIPDFLKINMHAWLTFESSESLDITLATSFALANNNPDGIGGIIHGNPKDLYNGLSFHPVILGKEVLFDIGLPTISMV